MVRNWDVQTEGPGDRLAVAEPAPAIVPERPANDTSLPDEIAFLEGILADRATLLRAQQLALDWRVSAERVLIDTGMIDQGDYYRELANHVGLPFTRVSEADIDWNALAHRKGRAMAAVNILPLRLDDGGVQVAVAPRGRGLRTMLMLARRPDAAAQLGKHIRIAPPGDLADALAQIRQQDNLHEAVAGLRDRQPQFSAAWGLTRLQRYVATGAAICIVTAAVAAAAATLTTALLLLSLLFAGLALLRILAIVGGDDTVKHAWNETPPVSEADLPVYTVLVPLFHEAAVVPRLIRALQRLDYPASKLDIKMIFEAGDEATLAAARQAAPPPCFDLLVVPPGEPRTKPRALNYAMQSARGSFVTIYDAEDRPEPDQLRKAVAAFRDGERNLGCVQARLAVHNANENWLTRQFALEYAALFDALLPALAGARLPLPLGGTSNHFRRSVLEAAGGWDPYNVTEDADLGMRLARLGYCCRTLASATYEEACATPMAWLRQRTRWLKGWMQTFIVHMRAPRQLWRDLGTDGFIVFLLLTLGTMATAIGYVPFAAYLGYQLWDFSAFRAAEHPVSAMLLFMGLFNAVVGYGAAFGAAIIGTRRRRIAYLLVHLPLMPVYWVGISVAACRALWQLARDPFRWEKTEHRHIPYRLAS